MKKLRSYTAGYVRTKADEIRRLNGRETDVRFTFLKAVGIFFVVLGHVGPGVSLFAEDWFAQGPMKLPLFVFVSGCFYAAKNDERVLPFLGKRARRLLVPYFVWNLLYGLLAWALRAAGVIDFGSPVTLKSLFWDPWVHGHQFQFNIAAWFLPALFLVSAVFVLLRFLLKKLHILNEWALLLFLFALSYVAIRFSQADYNHGPMLIPLRTAYFLFFYQLGFVCKTKLDGVRFPRPALFAALFLFSAAVTWCLAPTGAVTVWCVFTGSALGHLLSVVLSILFWLAVADALAPALEKLRLLKYVGENTFTVMMHHAVVIFAINSAFYVLSFTGVLSSFDAEKYRAGVWYAVPLFGGKMLLFYIAAGILVPCLGKYVWDRLTLRLDAGLTKNGPPKEGEL